MTNEDLIHILGPKTSLDIGNYNLDKHDDIYYDSGYAIKYVEYTTFSGGEIHLDLASHFSGRHHSLPDIVRARLQSSNDVMALFSSSVVMKAQHLAHLNERVLSSAFGISLVVLSMKRDIRY